MKVEKKLSEIKSSDINRLLLHHTANLMSEFYEMQSAFLTGIYKRYKTIESANIVLCFAKNTHLDSLLKKHSINHVDIMILDVEGDVFEVLNGYDHNSKIIDFLLVEVWKDDFPYFLQMAEEKKWEYIAPWGGSDHLFKLK